MKKTCSTLVLTFFAFCVFSQAPNKMSYQAVIRNSNNALVINAPIGIQISILKDSASGSAVYIETQTLTTNANGLVSMEIGTGTSITGTFSGINWSNGPYFIKTEIDPLGGTTYSISGTSELMSVPYALYAKSSGSSNGGFVHYIGENFGGGIIFHLWKDVQGFEHGLVVDIIDLSTSTAWSNIASTLIGVTAQSSWNGLSNSNSISAQAGHTSSAAALCLNSNNGGQNDWYLPSIKELSMLSNNYYTIARALAQTAGASELTLVDYWSSKEADDFNAWAFGFGNMRGYVNGKATVGYVRAIRAF
jgi:hypothetical protein